MGTEKNGTFRVIKAKTKKAVYIGKLSGKTAVWKGIRYAKAPDGSLRFMPPKPAPAEEKPVRCMNYSAKALQRRKKKDRDAMSEDCLFLNIWSPYEKNKKKPVMVYIHGGSFVKGTGNSPEYDGTLLCERGDVLVVTVNYRLGILGFMDFSFLGEDFYANCGIRDCLLAIKWVKENIEAFGGDPENITLFGQSAGAIIISTLLSIPEAQQLTKRAILMSCGPTLFRTKKDSQELSGKFLEFSGLSLPEELKSISGEALTKLQSAFAAYLHYGEGTYMPEIDGELVKEYPIMAARKGLFDPKIPILMGTTREELSCLFIPPIAKALDIETLFNTGKGREEPELSAKIAKAYERYGKRGPSIMMSDIIFKLSCTWLAGEAGRYAKVWMYSFEYETPLMTVSKLHAFHSSDLVFAFGNFHKGMGRVVLPLRNLTGSERKAQEISRKLQDMFRSFVKNDSLPWETCAPGNTPGWIVDKNDGMRPIIEKDILKLYDETRYKAAAFEESGEGIFS